MTLLFVVAVWSGVTCFTLSDFVYLMLWEFPRFKVVPGGPLKGGVGTIFDRQMAR